MADTAERRLPEFTTATQAEKFKEQEKSVGASSGRCLLGAFWILLGRFGAFGALGGFPWCLDFFEGFWLGQFLLKERSIDHISYTDLWQGRFMICAGFATGEGKIRRG